jgi:hypothetical protein
MAEPMNPNPAAASAATAASAGPVTDIDLKAKLLALLGLDDTTDAAAIDAKISEISTAAPAQKNQIGTPPETDVVPSREDRFRTRSVVV